LLFVKNDNTFISSIQTKTRKVMKTEQFKIGDYVEKLGAVRDYATGRQGTIIELEPEGVENRRARVCWDAAPSYDTIGGEFVRNGKMCLLKPIRTWVNFKNLKIVQLDSAIFDVSGKTLKH
jgi:hypothetical protein